MATATITKPAPAKPVTPTQEQIDAAILAIRNRWDVADKGEASAWKAREAADIAWQNARVVKVRVAYAAAMVKPEKGGTNLLNAARILLTDPADKPAKRTAQAKSRKNTLRNYVDAGAALAEKGLAERLTEPDEDERAIVAAVFREGNKRDKAEAKGEGNEGEGNEGNEGEGDKGDDNALTFSDLLAHLARAVATTDALIAASVPVTEDDLKLYREVTDKISQKLALHVG